MPNQPMSLRDSLFTHPIDKQVYGLHRTLTAMGFPPLTVEEIHQVLMKVTPRTAINGQPDQPAKPQTPSVGAIAQPQGATPQPQMTGTAPQPSLGGMV